MSYHRAKLANPAYTRVTAFKSEFVKHVEQGRELFPHNLEKLDKPWLDELQDYGNFEMNFLLDDNGEKSGYAICSLCTNQNRGTRIFKISSKDQLVKKSNVVHHVIAWHKNFVSYARLNGIIKILKNINSVKSEKRLG